MIRSSMIGVAEGQTQGRALRAGRNLGACLVACAMTMAGSPAVAQSNEQRADELFRQGQARLQAGQTEEACVLLAESLRLEPALGTLLNLARCHEKEGRIATALRAYTEAAAWALQKRESEREQFARERAAELEREVPRLRVEIANAPRDAGVELDGRWLSPSERDMDIFVDSGLHRIAVLAPGKKEWRRNDIRVEPRGMIVVRVVLEEETPSAKGAPRRDVLGYAVGAVGIGALGTGVALLLRASALDAESQREAERAKRVTPADPASKVAAFEAHDAALTTQTFGLVATGVGLLAVGASVYILLSADPAETRSVSRAIEVVPRLGSNQGGFDIAGRF